MDKELIEKYFNGACTPGEAAAVRDFLLRHPEDAFLWRDWEEADGITSLPPKLADAMLSRIRESTIDVPKIRFLPPRRWAAAAIVLAGMLTVAFYWVKHDNSSLIPAVAEKPLMTVPEWTEQVNGSTAIQDIVLADGSQVRLSASSRIRYRRLFGETPLRDISLEGQAIFSVAKNPQKPFIVRSGAVTTTAIGTRFMVQAAPGGTQVMVQLYEGKVRVETGSPGARGVRKSFILKPGQELLYKGDAIPVRIRKITSLGRKVVPGLTAPVAPNTLKSSVLFNNQTLAEVLDQISVMYKVPVKYNRAQIGNRYFIGTIDPGDSIDKIIRDIGLLNRLSVHNINGTYILK